jgi:hypothetical protein
MSTTFLCEASLALAALAQLPGASFAIVRHDCWGAIIQALEICMRDTRGVSVLCAAATSLTGDTPQQSPASLRRAQQVLMQTLAVHIADAEVVRFVFFALSEVSKRLLLAQSPVAELTWIPLLTFAAGEHRRYRHG